MKSIVLQSFLTRVEWQSDAQLCFPHCQWGVGLGPLYIKQIYKLGNETYEPYFPSAQ